MNLENEPPKSPDLASSLSEMFGEGEGSQKDKTIAELEGRLEREIEGRNEERFIWVVAMVLVLDLVSFTQMNNFGGPTAIVVIEILFLTILGRRLGVDDVAVFTNKILDKLPIKHSD